MKVIFNEIKKIFNFKMVAILLLGSLVIYELFISFYIDYFPNGRPALDSYNIGCNMIKKYGNNMDEKEFADFKQIYNEKVEEANKYLSSREDCKKANIRTYEDFKNTMDSSDKNSCEIHNEMMNEDIFWELQEMERIVDRYERRDEIAEKNYSNKNYKKRIETIVNGKGLTDILPEIIHDDYNDAIGHVARLILVSVVFMLLPLFLRDNKNKVNYIQYTSKRGRNIFKDKVTAGLISAFIITTVQLSAFFILYSKNNVSMFFNSSINSFFNSHVYWYDMTFIQYIIMTVVGIYVLSFVATLIAAFVSSKASNYMTAIGISVPILFAIGWLSDSLLINQLAVIYIPKMLAPIGYIVLITISIVLIAMGWRKEKGTDIL